MNPRKTSGGWLLLAAGLLFLCGCVSRGEYDRVVEQNRALRQALQAAKERIQALSGTRAEPGQPKKDGKQE